MTTSTIAEPVTDAERLRQWRDHGYVIVRGVFDADRVARLRPIFEHIRSSYLDRDALSGRPGREIGDNSLSQPHHPDYFVGRPEWRDEVLSAGSDERVLAIPRLVYGGEEPLFRSFGYWFNPEHGNRSGTWHRDTQFFFPDPEVERRQLPAFMAGGGNAAQFQIALVPNSDFELVPGSHQRWDTPEEFRIRLSDGTRHNASDAMPGALRIHLEAGDGVIFNPFGLHRGRYRADLLRRTFMLTTTWASAPMSDRYSNQPWFLDPSYTANLAPASRAFFQRFIDVYAGWWRGGPIAGVTFEPDPDRMPRRRA